MVDVLGYIECLIERLETGVSIMKNLLNKGMFTDEQTLQARGWIHTVEDLLEEEEDE